MKRTPRYIRLAVLGLGVSTWIISKTFEQHLHTDLMFTSQDVLPIYLSVLQLTTALSIMNLAIAVWLFAPQEKRSN